MYPISLVFVFSIALMDNVWADQPTQLDEVIVEGQLNKAREGIAPSLGASEYNFNQDAIVTQSQGKNAGFNEVILRAPGVAEDSFGQLHIRGEHANLQYRINNVLIPEGISGFGQTFDTRFIDSVSLITGSLPAQYGFHTAGIVDIHTKSGIINNGGAVSMYGGSYATLSPSFLYGGSDAKNGVNYFATGSYLRDNCGIENPTRSERPIHDQTQQGKSFVYLSKVIDDTSRITLMVNAYYGNFQIPDIGRAHITNLSQLPTFTLGSATFFDPSKLNERQTEQNYFAILSYQKTIGNFNFQLSAFSQYNDVLFKPDINGDLIINGVAGRVLDRNISNGIELDSSYVINDQHTLRGGFLVINNNATNNNTSWIFPGTGAGASLTQTGTIPYDINDNHGKEGVLYGVYLQDEWKVIKPLTINFGGRFDQSYQYLNENQFSPRANAIWDVYKDTDSRFLIHAGYARYFTPPPIELAQKLNPYIYNNTTNALEVPLNSPAKAERSNYYDAGITYDFSKVFKIGLDGYYKTAQNQLDSGQFGAAIIQTPFNYSQGKVYGTELTTNWKIRAFSASANVAYSRARGKHIDSEQFDFGLAELSYISKRWIYLDHDQTITASAGVSYKFSYNGCDTIPYVDFLYGSGLRKTRFDGVPNGAHVSSHYPINIGIEHTFKLTSEQKLKLRFDVVNLLDQVYALRSGTGVGVGAPQYGRRRSYYGGLEYIF